MEQALAAAQQAGELPPLPTPAFEVEIPRSEQFGERRGKPCTSSGGHQSLRWGVRMNISMT